jgi:hypothetical protein
LQRSGQSSASTRFAQDALPLCLADNHTLLVAAMSVALPAALSVALAPPSAAALVAPCETRCTTLHPPPPLSLLTPPPPSFRNCRLLLCAQLLLDAYNLKTLMLRLPGLGLGAEAEAAPVPLTYSKYVTKQMGKIEMVLKLIGTPDDMLVERFR